ncbi:glutamate receptor 2.7-like isoform X2 [Cornus florida]|nr:glutamate receptor 2.7-like isoform X2 [Cornus florida]XP_059640871.1 glutamate receptor 2.7-like isoform X2 [Cornus florida]
MSQTCMFMALDDFYANHNYNTRIVLHKRDSKNDIVEAASAAVDLIKYVQVQAILGPQSSTQADFVIDIGNKAQVPIISHATSPFISPKETPYFIRAAQNASSQVDAIVAMVKAFGWREVVLLYDDNDFGRGIAPYLTDALQKMSTKVPYRSVISPSATDDQILQELYHLMTMQSRVFVVHMLPPLASRLFLKAKEAGMMREGYAWIITDVLTSLLDSLEYTVVDSMQGVLGVKPYIPRSMKLDNFTRRWRKRFHQENPETDMIELNIYGMWAYDSVMALAMAIESADIAQPIFNKPVARENLTDFAAIGTSEMGPKLLQSIRNMRFKGLSGDFHLVDGQLQPLAFQIVNINGKGGREIGFWTRQYGISEKLMPSKKNYSTKKDDLRTIIWPGESNVVPKGWEMPTSEKRLRVGVPSKSGFGEFLKVEMDPQTKAVIPTGFCIDVFNEVMDSLPYAVPYDFVPFETAGESDGNYDEFIYQVFLEKFDAVVGDITILANRSKYVDFTLPYTESGVFMIVPIKADERKNAWIFMKPLTMDLWLTIGAFFFSTGFVVWVLEHRVNKEFRGPPHKQVGMIFWFSFSTLVFAHKEKVMSNLTRFVVIVWVFVVLVLTSSYTASLTSMLTVKKLEPTITNVNDLIRNGEFVGYQTGSFVEGLLESLKVDKSKFRDYSTLEEYDKALSIGSRNGGVAAIVEEVPYIKLFLAKYCKKYTMIGLNYKTAGFGFAFPKGSPFVADVSRRVLDVTEGDGMARLARKWLGDEADCAEQDGTIVTSDSLTLDSFRGLFLIAGVSSSFALIMYFFIFLHENKDILTSNESIWQKLTAIAKIFDEEKENSSDASKKTSTNNEGPAMDSGNAVPLDVTPHGAQSPAISFFHNSDGFLSQDEGFSTTEPDTPITTPITREITEER